MTAVATPTDRQRHLARNTLLVGAAFALAAGAGMGRNLLIARRFGIGPELDAYYAAFKLPDLLFTVVAGGALATAFLPVFVEVLATRDRQAAWRLASAVTNLVILVVGALAIVTAILAPWLVHHIIAPGFTPQLQDETAALMQLVLISTLIFGVSSVQTSALHGFKHFLLPALAPVVYPLGVVGGALWLVPTWGVRGLAAGAVAGAALHLAIKAPALVAYGFRWWPALDLNSPAVRRVAVLLGPRVLDLGVFHLTLLATTNLASRLTTGSVSALEWGWDAMQIPETMIGTAFGLVAFPTLADLAARGDLAGLRNTLRVTLQQVLILTLPAACGLILLGRPLLQLVYQRGAFDAGATEAVYVALRFYALGLVGHATLELVARTFFARQDTVTPLLVAAGSAAANVLLAVLLMGPLGHGGLALANSLAVSAEVVVLLLILRRRIGGLEGRDALGVLARALLATAVMAVVIVVVLRLAAAAGAGTMWAAGGAGIAGLLVYAGCGLLMGVSPRRVVTGVLR